MSFAYYYIEEVNLKGKAHGRCGLLTGTTTLMTLT